MSLHHILDLTNGVVLSGLLSKLFELFGLLYLFACGLVTSILWSLQGPLCLGLRTKSSTPYSSLFATLHFPESAQQPSSIFYFQRLQVYFHFVFSVSILLLHIIVLVISFFCISVILFRQIYYNNYMFSTHRDQCQHSSTCKSTVQSLLPMAVNICDVLYKIIAIMCCESKLLILGLSFF